MKLNEHMSKELFSRAEIPLPRGFLYSKDSSIDLEDIEFGFPWVVKAQVLSGGRGKGGGIAITRDRQEFLQKSYDILEMAIDGESVPFVRVEEAIGIHRECYLSFSINRSRQSIVLSAGIQGGVDIENTSEGNLQVQEIDICQGIKPYQIRSSFFHMNLPPQLFKQWSKICFTLYETLITNNLLIAEINPLAISENENLIALDGKAEIDDSYCPLKPELKNYFLPQHMDAVELQASHFGLSYHKLSGNVGLMVNGAGLAMATMDLLNFSGLPPANFLDVGGGASEENMSAALDILGGEENVQVIFINIFGGILSCAKVARAIRSVWKDKNMDKPVVVRFSGFESQEAKKIIQGVEYTNLLQAEDLNDALQMLKKHTSEIDTKEVFPPRFTPRAFSKQKLSKESSEAFLPRNCNVLVQGITGREGMLHSRQMLDYGTKVVAGVTPFKGGGFIQDIPVYNTVKDACGEHSIHASIIFVPAAFAADAILEAADAGIEWVVCITEGIPQQEMLRVKKRLGELRTRLIGPNTPGIIIPGQNKVGIMPGNVFTPGPVAVLSRSGTLTYESIFRLTRAGIGQSVCLGIGGDPFVGSSFKDIASLLVEDPATRALLVLGEIGGQAEEELAMYLQQINFDRPLFGFIAGQTAPQGKQLGHAGAILEQGNKINEKLSKMHEYGYTICPDLASIPQLVGEIFV